MIPQVRVEPIEDAPKDGTWILGFRPLKHYCDQWEVWRWVQTNEYTGWEDAADHCDFDDAPTHWMPLPDAPSALETKEGE